MDADATASQDPGGVAGRDAADGREPQPVPVMMEDGVYESAVFAVPTDAEYNPEVVLVQVDPTLDKDALVALLGDVEGVVAESTDFSTAEAGFVSVALAPGTSVEEGVNAILAAGSDLVEGAQPDYAYHLADAHAPEELRAALDVPFVAQGEAAEAELEAVQGAASEAELEAVPEDGDEAEPDTAPASDAEANPTPGSDPAPGAEADERTEADERLDVELEVAEEGEDAVILADGQEEDPAADLPARLDPLALVSIDDPLKDELWGLTSMRAYEAWTLARSSVPRNGTPVVTVAVMDTGVDVGHEDLADNIAKGTAYNAAASRNKRGDSDVTPFADHGTHVAGIVGAVANNGVGVAGISYNARIMPIQVFVGSDAYTSDIVQAYRYVMAQAVSHNVRVANLSVGGGWGELGTSDTLLLTKMEEAYDAGIVTVAAAGNSSSKLPVPYLEYPGDSEYAVSVINLYKSASGGANDASGTYRVARSSSSNYNTDDQGSAGSGVGKNIAAPGNAIYSTLPTDSGEGSYGTKSGTSMAAPYVAGTLALMFTANPSLSAEDAVNLLFASAHDLGASGWDSVYGHGEADAYAAVRAAMGKESCFVLKKGTVTLSLEEDEYIYDGTQKQPAVTATLTDAQGETTDVPQDCYTVGYEDNVNAGVGKVCVAFSGDYASLGTKTLLFSIGRKSLGDDDVQVAANPASFVYGDGEWVESGGDVVMAHGAGATVRAGGRLLAGKTDFTWAARDFTDVGTATLVVKGEGNYRGERTLTYPISRRSIQDARVSVVLATNGNAYDGAAKCPAVTVMLTDAKGVQRAVASDDYHVSYANNTQPGTATVTVEGENNLSGTVQKTFSITRAGVSVPSAKSLTYNGTRQTAVVAGTGVTLTGTASATDAGSYTAYATPDAQHCWAGGGTETRRIVWSIVRARISVPVPAKRTYNAAMQTGVAAGSGYVLGATYRAVDAGSYTAEVTPDANHCWSDGGTGPKRLSWRIAPADISRASVSSIKAKAFKGTAIKPVPTVKSAGMTLRKGKDYTLAYANNVEPGKASVTVAGKGNWTGSKKTAFSIYLPKAHVAYRAYVQSSGWQPYKRDGAKSGTTGRSRRLEAIRIKLEGAPCAGSIEYRTYVQSSGWQPYKRNGAKSGTTGKGRRTEAIRIRLTGKMAKYYDVWYRVHTQNFGWMGWTKNGASAGSRGYSKRLEAIQVKVLPKGSAAPGKTAKAFRQR